MAKLVTFDQLTATVERVAVLLGIVAEAADTEFSGATSLAAGSKGCVPAPVVGDQNKFLCGDGTWATPSLSGATYSVGPTAPSTAVIWFKTGI